MAKTRPGRPEWTPTDKERAQVKLLVAVGTRDHDVAKVIGVSLPTLRKHCWAEMDVGHIEANANVARSLYAQATHKEKPNVTAAIFWLKCRAGWREDGGETGKKQQAAAAAETAAHGTTWEGLLHPQPQQPQ